MLRVTDKEPLTDYILGRLTELEKSRLEAAYFADTSLFERICEVEARLVSSYVDGKLTGRRRRELEARMRTSAALRDEVRFRRELGRAVKPAGQSTIRRAVSWLGESLVGPSPTVVLAPGLLRGNSTRNRVAVPPGAKRVQLKLRLRRSQRRPAYDVVIENVDLDRQRRVPRKQLAESSSGAYVVVDLTLRTLPFGDYRVRLSGGPSVKELVEIDTYPLRLAPGRRRQ